MNSPTDSGPISPDKPADTTVGSSYPANWREASMALIASRISLIQLESKDAKKETGRRVVMIVAAAGCALVTWALTLAGGIAWIAEAAHWPWHRVALIAAAVHMLVGIILIRLAKPSGNPSFPITRAEFQKDREWIENFQKTNKSSN